MSVCCGGEERIVNFKLEIEEVMLNVISVCAPQVGCQKGKF